jgi:hypothetical protein
MDLFEEIIAVYPEAKDSFGVAGTIRLRDDSDGFGQYIAEWNYSKPIPAGLKLGK